MESNSPGELYVFIFSLTLAAAIYTGWFWFALTGKLRSPLEWKSSDFPLPKFSGKVESAALLASLLKDIPSSHELAATRRSSLADPQHQRLFDHAHDLRYAIFSGQPKEKLNGIIDVFVQDMVQHFRDEEATHAAAGDPRTAQHAAEHRELVNSVNARVRRFRAGRSEINELFRYVADEVLGRHALEEEREFASRAAMPA
jgi:hemerythrin-like metal-binding protein